jgi:hypothetical protein
MCLHFDNCHIHNKRTIAQTMPEWDFYRLDHPSYSQDLAFCNCFVSDYLHEKISRSVYETVEKLE